MIMDIYQASASLLLRANTGRKQASTRCALRLTPPVKRSSAAAVLVLTLVHLMVSFVVRPAEASTFYQGAYIPFDNVDVGSIGGVSARLNGNIAISFADTEIDAELDQNQDFDAASGLLKFRAIASLELSAQDTGELTLDLPLAVIPLPEIQISPSVVAVPYIYPTLRGAGSVQRGAKISMVVPIRTAASFDKTVNNGAWRGNAARITPQIGLPDADILGNANLELTLDFRMHFQLIVEGIPVGGPFIGTEVGIDLDLDPLGKNWWTLDGLTRVTAGWGAVLSLPKTPNDGVTLIERNWQLAAGGPLPVDLPVTRWSRTFDLGHTAGVDALVPVDDHLLLTGEGFRSNGGPWMAELDSGGSPVWETGATDSANAMYPVAMQRLENGDLLAAGRSAYNDGMRVERYDASGSPLWAKTMQHATASSARWTAMALTGTGGAVLGGYSSYLGSANAQRLLLAEIDGNANIVWAQEIELGDDAAEVITALAVDGSGEIIVVGHLDYDDHPDPAQALVQVTNGFIVRLSPTGDLIRAKALGSIGDDYLLDLTLLPTGDYLVGGDSDKEDQLIWISRLTSDDELVWSSSYGGANLGSRAGVTGLTTLSSGLIGVAGFENADGAKDAVLMTIDGGGMPVWYKRLAGDDEDALQGIIALDDGLAAYGHTKSASAAFTARSEFWLARTSVDGMLHFDPASGLVTVNDAVTWAPATYTSLVTLPTVSEFEVTLDVVDAGLEVESASAVENLLTL